MGRREKGGEGGGWVWVWVWAALVAGPQWMLWWCGCWCWWVSGWFLGLFATARGTVSARLVGGKASTKACTSQVPAACLALPGLGGVGIAPAGHLATRQAAYRRPRQAANKQKLGSRAAKIRGLAWGFPGGKKECDTREKGKKLGLFAKNGAMADTTQLLSTKYYQQKCPILGRLDGDLFVPVLGLGRLEVQPRYLESQTRNPAARGDAAVDATGPCKYFYAPCIPCSRASGRQPAQLGSLTIR